MAKPWNIVITNLKNVKYTKLYYNVHFISMFVDEWFEEFEIFMADLASQPDQKFCRSYCLCSMPYFFTHSMMNSSLAKMYIWLVLLFQRFHIDWMWWSGDTHWISHHIIMKKSWYTPVIVRGAELFKSCLMW